MPTVARKVRSRDGDARPNGKALARFSWNEKPWLDDS
jgi:hypothetical protein